MRIVKEAKERRNEILDAADELFSEKGFEKTSTNDILERVKIARGTLYYHFKSKEDIMDGLIERYSDRLLEAAKEIAENESMPVRERLVKAVKTLNIEGEGGEKMKEKMHKQGIQNALMHQKAQQVVIENVPGILCKIIEDGIAAGEFDTPYPYEAMEMVIVYANIVFDALLNDGESEEELQKKVEAFAFNLERLLGTKEGSLKECIFQMF